MYIACRTFVSTELTILYCIYIHAIFKNYVVYVKFGKWLVERKSMLGQMNIG